MSQAGVLWSGAGSEGAKYSRHLRSLISNSGHGKRRSRDTRNITRLHRSMQWPGAAQCPCMHAVQLDTKRRASPGNWAAQ